MTVWVSGTPPAPRTGARGGHTRVTPSVSPAPRAGLIVFGDQATRHVPLRSVRRTVVTGFQAPAWGRSKCSVTRARAVFPEEAVMTRPAVKVARVTPSAANAATLTDRKSAGGAATWWRMAVQSPRPQAARKLDSVALAVGAAGPHPLRTVASASHEHARHGQPHPAHQATFPLIGMNQHAPCNQPASIMSNASIN